MRSFDEVDKTKKQKRIKIEENPGNLSEELLVQVEEKVKASLKNGYLSCPVAWRIAGEANVTRVVVGNITDKLGVRITNCQVGCFKVDKTIHDNLSQKKIDDTIVASIETLERKGELTCAKVHEIALKYKLTPMNIADFINLRGWKMRQCQLGCF
jgi:hypothetical protein